MENQRKTHRNVVEVKNLKLKKEVKEMKKVEREAFDILTQNQNEEKLTRYVRTYVQVIETEGVLTKFRGRIDNFIDTYEENQTAKKVNKLDNINNGMLLDMAMTLREATEILEYSILAAVTFEKPLEEIRSIDEVIESFNNEIKACIRKAIKQMIRIVGKNSNYGKMLHQYEQEMLEEMAQVIEKYSNCDIVLPKV